jgi:hypothetical protein
MRCTPTYQVRRNISFVNLRQHKSERYTMDYGRSEARAIRRARRLRLIGKRKESKPKLAGRRIDELKRIESTG